MRYGGRNGGRGEMGEWLEVGREGRTDGRREEGRVIIGRVVGWREGRRD